MFMLTRDRMSIDFDKSILEMMLKLLAIEEDDENCKSKEWTRLSSKLKTLFEKDEIKGIKNLDLSKLTSASLARESFLSLTLQRTGSWFKEEVRLLGGLDHIVDTVVSCSQSLVKKGKEIELGSNARKIERCLKLLENVTVHCSTNQEYVINYRNSALLDGCARLLKYSANFLSTCQEAENWDEVAALWFSAMKILLNLTNDNENTCTKFCQQTDILSILLRSALQLPQYLPQAKQFDVIVLSLGLLLNLVEHSTKNISALNAAVAPACHESSNQDAEKSLNENEDHLAVESLMELFMVRLEAAKDNNGIDEDLSKLNSSLHNSSIRIGPDGVSLVCGDELEGEAATSSKRDSIESAPSGKTSAEREAEHLGKALQRAGKHMEDSLIASYAALLVTLLAENNQENQIAIHEKLANGDFGIMKHTLDKFLAFMNMATTQNNSSSSQIIKRAIQVLEQCKLDHPPRGADAAGSSVET